MKKIIFPLNPRMQGTEVANLQDVLQLFLDRRALLANNEGMRQELSEALKPERAEQIYDGATKKLVAIFQEERRLEVSGAVDEATAQAMNALLQEWGLLGQTNLPRFVVSGEVRREDNLPLGNLRVSAIHEIDRTAIGLGEDTTDAGGRYTIRYEPLPEITECDR
jgi:hypothetical protein